MHGFTGYLIIGGCACAGIAGFVALAMDMRKSRRAAKMRQKLMSRIGPK